jgi:hypothetical protein
MRIGGKTMTKIPVTFGLILLNSLGEIAKNWI